MYRTVQLVLLGVLAVLFGLSALSRRFPDIAWLQLFRFNAPRLSEEQRARMRQRANILAGVKLILLGVVVPIGYVAITIMMFNTPTTLGITIALASTLVLIGLGITAIVTSRSK